MGPTNVDEGEQQLDNPSRSVLHEGDTVGLHKPQNVKVRRRAGSTCSDLCTQDLDDECRLSIPKIRESSLLNLLSETF